MKCKKILGMRICKLNSSEIVQLPKKADVKIPVNIYTSSNCKLCKTIVNKQLRSLNPLKGLIETRIIDIEKNKNFESKILSLPSIEIGNDILGSLPSDKKIIYHIQKYLKKVNNHSL